MGMNIGKKFVKQGCKFQQILKKGHYYQLFKMQINTATLNVFIKNMV